MIDERQAVAQGDPVGELRRLGVGHRAGPAGRSGHRPSVGAQRGRAPVCPTPIGSYEYRKRRANGASIMYNVEVFPLAVTNELEDWKEMDERDRKWFSFRDAASAVEEPDLQALIRSFGDGGFRAVAAPRSVVFEGGHEWPDPLFAAASEFVAGLEG